MKKVISVFFLFICLLWGFLFPVSAQNTVLLQSSGAETETELPADNALPVSEGEEKERDATVPGVAEADIQINTSAYKALVTSEQKKQYSVSVSVDQSEYKAAKINIRGNSSRQFGLQTSTKRIPFELLFSVEQDFAGIQNKSIKFINCFYPYRLIAEYLALDLFSFAGIPTPAHSFVFVRFNDVDFGLYIAVEDVNKTFLSKWYQEPLYSAYKSTINAEKESEYINTVWFGHLFEKVSGGSKTLSVLLDALDKGEGYEQYINVDEWLRYFACVSVTGGDGSMLTEQNNFVLYDNNGKFDLIPWDLSEAFSGKKMPGNIDRYYLWQNENNPNPLFDLIMSNQTYKEQYRKYIREYTEGFLNPSAIEARYEAILDAIAPYLPRDHSILLNGEETLSELRSDSPDSFANLWYMLNAYYLNLSAQLEGEETDFVVNDQFADYYENGDSYEFILSEIEPRSPLLDPALPEKIIDQGKRIQTEEQSRTGWVLGVSVVSAAIFFIICLLIINRKTGVRGIGASVKYLLQGIKKWTAKHKVMFCFLLFIVLYECFFAWQFRDWTIGSYNYVYHALDYRLGFCSRLLVGAVSNFLLGEVTVLKVTVFETVLLLLVFVCLSWFLEKLYYRFEPTVRPYALFLMFLFVTGPCTFGIYVKELGMFDVWWLYCTVIIFFLLFKKKLWPLIVIFAFVMILISFSSILCFAPFIVIILLYKATMEPDPGDRRRLTVIAGLFAVVAIGFTMYFMNYDRGNVKITPEEFYALLRSRGCESDDEVYNVVFGVVPEGYGISQGTKSFWLYQIVGRIQFHISVFLKSSKIKYWELACAVLLISPVLGLMQSFFRYKMKNSKQLMQKFVFFCMLMLFFFVNVTCFFVSTDSQKWLAHGFTLTFACLLVVLYHEPQVFSERIKPQLQKIPLPVLICYGMIYAVMIFHPYS